MSLSVVLFLLVRTLHGVHTLAKKATNVCCGYNYVRICMLCFVLTKPPDLLTTNLNRVEKVIKECVCVFTISPQVLDGH